MPRIIGGCPVIGSAASAEVNPSNQMPYQSEAQEQPGSLQTNRQASSIPLGESSAGIQHPCR